MVIGASGATQLAETLLEVENGPLDPWTVQMLDRMWEEIYRKAPCDKISTMGELAATSGTW